MTRKASPAPQPGAAPGLSFDLPPLEERIQFPAPYADHWADVVLDTPECSLDPQALKVTVLGQVVVRWSFRLADGSPAPVGEAAMVALMEQAPPLALWLYDEWLTRRLRPLAVPPTRRNGASLPPPTT